MAEAKKEHNRNDLENEVHMMQARCSKNNNPRPLGTCSHENLAQELLNVAEAVLANASTTCQVCYSLLLHESSGS